MSSSDRSEAITTRALDAVVIPHGSPTRIPFGTKVMIMQKLGGTVTVTTEYGGLYRIDPENLDAIGMEVPAAPAAAAAGDAGSLDDRVWEVLRSCYDPEIPVNIVELGLVYSCLLDPPAEDGRRITEMNQQRRPGDARDQGHRNPDRGTPGDD